MPLSDRSGLNYRGLVNRSNVTSFQNEPNDDAYVQTLRPLSLFIHMTL